MFTSMDLHMTTQLAWEDCRSREQKPVWQIAANQENYNSLVLTLARDFCEQMGCPFEDGYKIVAVGAANKSLNEIGIYPPAAPQQ